MIERLPARLFEWPHFARFATVGILGASVDLMISMSLTLMTEIPPELAKFVGAEVAIVVMFVVNDRWTFGDITTRGWRQWIYRLLKSNVVRAGGLTVQILVVFVLIRVGISVFVGETDVWPALTMPIAIACGFVVNYLGETLVTWRVRR